MSKAQMNQYRELREQQMHVERALLEAQWANEDAQVEPYMDGSSIGEGGLAVMQAERPLRFARLYNAHYKAAHRMLQSVMDAPESSILGPVEDKEDIGSRGHRFPRTERAIWTPELGEFVATEHRWDDQVRGQQTRLTLSYVFTKEPWPDHKRTEDIISTVTKELDMAPEDLQRIDERKLPKIMIGRERVAAVCEQAGLRVVIPDLSAIQRVAVQ
jgi:hypothetical protein